MATEYIFAAAAMSDAFGAALRAAHGATPPPQPLGATCARRVGTATVLPARWKAHCKLTAHADGGGEGGGEHLTDVEEAMPTVSNGGDGDRGETAAAIGGARPARGGARWR